METWVITIVILAILIGGVSKFIQYAVKGMRPMEKVQFAESHSGKLSVLFVVGSTLKWVAIGSLIIFGVQTLGG